MPKFKTKSFQTHYDEQLSNGSHVPPHEQAADVVEAKSRTLIINKKSTALNEQQKAELSKHSALGGSFAVKPYCDKGMEDFSYVANSRAD